MMKAKIATLVTIITLIFAITTGSVGLAWGDSDKDYC